MDDKEKLKLKDTASHILTANNEARIRERSKRDESFLKVTMGALVLSVSFLTISGLDNKTAIFLIIWSWIFFLLSIFFFLLAYITVDLFFEKREKDIISRFQENKITVEMFDETNVWEWRTDGLNYLSYASTFLGLLFLVLFGVFNINSFDLNKSMNKNTSAGDQQKFANTLSSTVIVPENEGTSSTATSQPTSTPVNTENRDKE